MADIRVVYTVTQKPGMADWIVMWPSGEQVATARVTTEEEIEPMIRRNLAYERPETAFELERDDVPFDQIFGTGPTG